MLFSDFLNNSSDSCVFILVGNKKDCKERKVTISEGAKLAAKLHISFLECSAYTGENLEEIFKLLIRNIERCNIVPRSDKKSIIIKKNSIKKTSKCC